MIVTLPENYTLITDLGIPESVISLDTAADIITQYDNTTFISAEIC